MDYKRTLLSLWILFIVQCQAEWIKKTAIECKGPSATLRLSCPRDHLIHVRNTTYGQSRLTTDWVCPTQVSVEHCTHSDQESFDCNGKRLCSVPFTSIPRLSNIPGCSVIHKDSTYAHVEYTCVPVTDIEDICAEPAATSQGKVQGYLKTPNYPGHYPAGAKCNFVLEGYVKSLVALDMKLANPEDCLGYDGDQYASFCNGRPQNIPLISNSNVGQDASSDKVTLTFQTDTAGQGKGIWLYYELKVPEKYIRTTTPPSLVISSKPDIVSTFHRETLPKVTPTKSSEGEQTGNNADKIIIYENINNKVEDDPETLTITTIIGLVVGCLTFLLILLSVVFLLRRHLQKKPTKDRSDSQHAMWQGQELNVESGLFTSSQINRPSTCTPHPTDSFEHLSQSRLQPT